MSANSPLAELRTRLVDQLGPDAVVEIVPARESGRFNVWVVAPTATEIVPDIIEATPANVRDQIGTLQVYDSQEEADQFGVRLNDTVATRPDWLSRLRAGMPSGDADPAFDAPLVVGFYSFRGGVGRTTALAHCAAVLAKRGRRVVVVDADLEAPGLHHALGVAPQAARSAKPFIDLLAALERDPGLAAKIDVRDYLVAIESYEDLYLLPAGEADADYLTQLDALTIRSWTVTERNPVRAAIDAIVQSPLEPDVVLVDARTGLTDSNALLLLGACDHVVIVFYPSEQSRAGTDLVTQTLARGTGRRGLPVGVHFLASPIPAGRGTSTDPGLVERAKEWATTWSSRGNGADDVQDPDFLAIPYAEALALSDRLTTDPVLLEPYQTIADWIDPLEGLPEGVHNPAVIRSELSFTAGNSDVPDQDVRALFVRTEDANRVQSERILLVEGRKGTGKTTLFRWLIDEENAVAVTSPEALRTGTWWPTRDIWERLAQLDHDFRLTWPMLIALRTAEETPAILAAHADIAHELSAVQAAGVGGLIDAIQRLASSDQPAVAALDMMVRSLQTVPTQRRLVFDGLDTTFGFAVADRSLRDVAIGSLLPLLMDREASLSRVRFTVFLRTDIVRGISFANQSHLFGRRLTLVWDKEDYLKTVLKQALTSSSAFARETGSAPADVDALTEDRTLQIWYALVGVRVRGKQTAFTDRWIWSRLADGHGDHSPRHIAQLFTVLADRARGRLDDPGPPLRARDFGTALSEVVSQEALTAVRDEFAREVDLVLPLFARLGQSPFTRPEWDEAGGDAETLALAETVGVVAVHPRDPDRLIVPELYRYALNVRRRGPA